MLHLNPFRIEFKLYYMTIGNQANEEPEPRCAG